MTADVDYEAIVGTLHPDVRAAAIALTHVTVPDGWTVKMLREGWIGVTPPPHDGVSFTFHIEAETTHAPRAGMDVVLLRWRVGRDLFAEAQQAVDAVVTAFSIPTWPRPHDA